MRKYENGAYLQQLQGGGGGVGVLQLELGPGVVEDGEEGEVAGVGVVAADDEQGAKDGEEDGEHDVEDVEPGVEGEQLAAGAQWVASLLREVGVASLPASSSHQGHSSRFLSSQKGGARSSGHLQTGLVLPHQTCRQHLQPFCNVLSLRQSSVE